MITKKILIVTVLAVLPLSVYAASDVAATPQEKFSSLDVNQDGYISRDEAKMDKKLSGKWIELDSNEDGKLEESEFSAFEEEMAPASDSETQAEPKAAVAE